MLAIKELENTINWKSYIRLSIILDNSTTAISLEKLYKTSSVDFQNKIFMYIDASLKSLKYFIHLRTFRYLREVKYNNNSSNLPFTTILFEEISLHVFSGEGI